MKTLFFILFLVLFGCGRKFDTIVDEEPKFSKTLDPTIFKAEVTEFIKAENETNPNKNLNNLSAEQQATYLMQSIPINLDDLTIKYAVEKFIGVCVKSTKSGKREVLIDRNYWSKNPTQRIPLILHELGHCWPSIQREHFTAPIGSGCRSIMESNLISSSFYTSYKVFLNYELFKKLNDFKSVNPKPTVPSGCSF